MIIRYITTKKLSEYNFPGTVEYIETLNRIIAIEDNIDKIAQAYRHLFKTDISHDKEGKSFINSITVYLDQYQDEFSIELQNYSKGENQLNIEVVTGGIAARNDKEMVLSDLPLKDRREYKLGGKWSDYFRLSDIYYFRFL